MKVLIAGLTSIAVLFLGGWQIGGLVLESDLSLEESPVESAYPWGISGAWHSFPAGMVIQLEPDGTLHFGADEHGRTFGYEAEAWNAGGNLSIRFTDYDGQDQLCQTTTGVYRLKLTGSGAVKFVPVDDQCQMRVNLLSGGLDSADEIVFRPVD